MGMNRRRWIGTGMGAALVGAVGVGLIVAPAGAVAAPQLPPVTLEDLVASVMSAEPGALAGTVQIQNGLGLPALPGLGAAANGRSTVRVWSGGDHKARVALPQGEGEKTFVSDGTTRWAYDSQDRTAVRVPQSAPGGPSAGGPSAGGPGGGLTADPSDPVAAASQVVGELRRSSTVTVDGTAEVAGRPAYQLVLTPAPTERTLLRQVRVAVDAQSRLPLQLTVLANGSAAPALQVGFEELTYGPQDPALFSFTPPPGTTVTDGPAGARGGPDRSGPPEGTQVVGDGWDTVVVSREPKAGAPGAPAPGAPVTPGAPAAPPAPAGRGPDAAGTPDLSTLGTPVSGPWGTGRVITTAVGTAIVTDDGRIAAGAVPEQVLTEALTR